MIIWTVPKNEERLNNLFCISAIKDFFKKMNVDFGAETFYNKLIDQFAKK